MPGYMHAVLIQQHKNEQHEQQQHENEHWADRVIALINFSVLFSCSAWWLAGDYMYACMHDKPEHISL